jgi:hypothetical protein
MVTAGFPAGAGWPVVAGAAGLVPVQPENATAMIQMMHETLRSIWFMVVILGA